MTTKKVSLLLWLICAWLIFVVSLTMWWMIFSIRTIHRLNEFVQDSEMLKKQNMLVMEGSVLILFLVFGGGVLIYFALREKSRFEEVRHFFTTFSHDLKTSLSRLILQSEALIDGDGKNIEKMKAFQKNLLVLEMQLENSLHYAQQDKRLLAIEPVDIKSMVSRLHTQRSDLKMSLNGQGKFLADITAIDSIFKNLVSNAALHGQADEIHIQVTKSGNFVDIQFSDNGQPIQINVDELGVGLMPSQKGSGIGLFLVSQWVRRLGGQLTFSKSESGSLAVTLRFPGAP